MDSVALSLTLLSHEVSSRDVFVVKNGTTSSSQGTPSMRWG